MLFTLSNTERESQTQALQAFSANVDTLKAYGTEDLQTLCTPYILESQWDPEAEKRYLALSADAKLLVDSLFMSLCGWATDSLFNVVNDKTHFLPDLIIREMTMYKADPFEQTSTFLLMLQSHEREPQTLAIAFLTSIMPDFNLVKVANHLLSVAVYTQSKSVNKNVA